MAAPNPRPDGVGLLLQPSMIPPHRRVRVGVFTVALVLHAALIVTLIVAQRARPVRMAPGDVMTTGIAAYIPGPTGTAGTSPTPASHVERPKKPAPTRATPTAKMAQDEPADSGGAVGTAGTQGSGAGSGPVRLGSGAGLTLLKKVTPAYPRILEQARMPGTVILDAVIHRDGTIGDVTVLKSSNPAFAQSAVEAVRQWRYTPIPFEGIVTVTVNFTPA